VIRRGLVAALATLPLAVLLSPAAVASPAQPRTIRFQSARVQVPSSWPVYRLARHPRMCVRLDRRAVYLGRPGANQRCPADAIGRRHAILVDPGGRARAARARARASRLPPVQASAASAFTGLGFDACTAPSRSAMTAWRSGSPYRAIGIYIGGLNRGCSQPNLTARWVREQTAAGWHLIPTYVGLQSPTSDCGSCAKLSSGAAASQGVAAATEGVEQAQLVGIGEGSPIYFDMESYSRTSSASRATLTFLAAWTRRLHALGYDSGVYSSSYSGIADLAGSNGTGYTEPDDIWIANWNGRRGTDDPAVPASAWSRHQRIHQYRGGHDETYRGVTINIDNDYVEGATVGSSSSDEDPMGHLDAAGSPAPGVVSISGWAFDPSAPARAISIRAYVGGRPGRQGVALYDLGEIAAQPRPDVGLAHTVAGANHGFNVSFPVAKSGREPVCVYAVDVGPGADKPLGCRAVGIAVPIAIRHMSTQGRALQLRLSCRWPPGVKCPGQILLRARVRVPAGRRRAHRARTRVARRAIGRRSFRLTGGRSHTFRVALSPRGRLLTRRRKHLRAQLVVAIPGGRRLHGVTLRRGHGLGR
jgi:Rv2525c-like, glycoside hydrolase-like domain